METFDLIVKSANAILPSGIAKVAIGVKGEKIAAILDDEIPLKSKEVIDAAGKIVIPGLIDMHVHFRDPGMTHKEDFATGSMSAISGGVTTVCDMPNNIPPVVSEDTFLHKIAAIENKSYCDYALWIGGRRIDEFRKLAHRGAIGIKVYLTKSHLKSAAYIDELFVEDDAQLFDIFEAAAAYNMPISIHADNFDISNRAREGLQKEGRTDYLAYAELRKTVASEEATSKAILMAKKTGAKLHLAHISLGSFACLDLVRKAKKEGLPVTAESPPAWLSHEELERLGPYALPFIMPKDEIDEYWAAMEKGDIDVIATDHAPHTIEEKELGRQNIWCAPTGFPCVELLLPLALTKSSQGILSLSRLVDLTSTAPAKILGLYPQKGVIAVGADADLVVVQPGKEKLIRASDLHSKAGWSPFEGVMVKGLPEVIILRGKIVAEKGDILGKPGYGQFIYPLRGCSA